MKRRNFIHTGILTGAGVALAPGIKGQSAPKKRVLRVAHVTDMHIWPDPVPEKAIRQLLDHLRRLPDQPDLVFNTGDHIMDALKRTKEEVAAQWEAWDTYFRSALEYELYSCIGNHDVWGWGLADDRIKNDPLYGKAWAKEQLKLSETYYSFERNGWKFIFLDSVSFSGNSHAYFARLDDDQFNWLRNELEATPAETPVCMVSHIPILSSSVFFDGENEKSGNWQIPGAWMHLDARRIKDLFYQHPNVKAALSGHVHLIDQVNYLNVQYFCNGAACGNWWKGSYQEFPPAYALIDFYEDGSVNTELIYYREHE